VTNGKRAIVHCKRFQQAICALTFGEGLTQGKISPSLFYGFYGRMLAFSDIPVKLRQKTG
jgi:hypothetical protein